MPIPVEPLGKYMTPSPMSISREMKLLDAMQIMREQRIRHLPVVEQGELVGIVSMGDLVKRKVADKELEITQLVEYIQTAGCPPA